MSNLSDLIPAGGGQNNTDFVADGGIASGKPVILTAAGKAAEIVGTAAALGTEGAAPGSARSGWEAGACYHASEGVVVVSFNNAWSYYPSCAVATTSGTTVTLSTPLVLKSSGASLNVCEYDSTQDRVVFHYITTGATAYGYVVAASLSGTTFTLGTELATFSGDDHGTGAMANLAPSKMIIVNGFTNSVITVSKAQVVSVSASVVTLGTAVQINPATCYQPRVASGKVDEFLCQLGQAVVTTMEFVAGTVSGTTITAGVITQLTGGTSYHNDLASGYWNGHTSPESTYMMAYHPPGAAADSQVARIVTVSGTTLTLNATTAIEDVSGNTPAMGWGNSATQALYFFRDGGSGWVTELTYSGTTVTKGATTEVGAGRYSNNSIVWDQTSNKAVLFYSNASDSDYATANCFTPGSTNLTASNLLGIASGAILDTATGTINTWGSRNEVQTGLTIASDYYAQTDGTITTSDGGQLLGKALSATMINIKDYTG
jgi:hypothetical protein